MSISNSCLPSMKTEEFYDRYCDSSGLIQEMQDSGGRNYRAFELYIRREARERKFTLLDEKEFNFNQLLDQVWKMFN